MSNHPPLRFRPIIKQALWGGQRLERELAKPTGGVTDAAESWEVCDLPGNVSVIGAGSLAGVSLRQLMETQPEELLGRHQDRKQFPLLIKFLDANQQLSVQVHPKDPTLQSDGTIRLGKAESWIVIDAVPGNRMYLGLREGVTEQQVLDAVRSGDFGDCLHHYEAKPGDCIYLEPGTVHALGDGLLIAEIQQPSDITYRLYDWGRTDASGKPRELHIEKGMAATNFDIGPVQPVVPRAYPGRSGSEVLMGCEHFVINRHRGANPLSLPQDDAMHILIVLQGSLTQGEMTLQRGDTVVVPASRQESIWSMSDDAMVLDTHLPA